MDMGLSGLFLMLFVLGGLLVAIGWIGGIADDIEGGDDSPWRFHG